MTDRDFIALRQVAKASLLRKAAYAVGVAIERSWTHSRVAGVMSRFGSLAAAMPVAWRIRVGAMTCAWAAAGYGVSLAIVPPYVRSAVPVAAIFSMAVLALIVAMMSERVAACWPHASLRRALRR